MFDAPLALLKVMRIVLMDVPQRILALFASCCLALVVWLHRHYHATSRINGGEAAATILAGHRIDTKVYRVEGWLVDCYYPKKNAILLSASNFDGTNVSALSIAAHEVGHVLQARRRYLPYWLSWLLARPAEIALAACFWLWLIGAAAEDRAFVLAGVACFALYLIYLSLQLVCEIDASRRGVQELIRHRFLQKGESRIARRILRAALGTYLAAFGGTALALTFFLPQISWRDLLGQYQKSPLIAPPDRQSSAAEQVLRAQHAWQPAPVHFDYRGFRKPAAITLTAYEAPLATKARSAAWQVESPASQLPVP